MGIANNPSDFYKERQRQEMKKKRDLIKNAPPDRHTQFVERARLARVAELQQKKKKTMQEKERKLQSMETGLILERRAIC